MPPVEMRTWMSWSELTNGPRITKEEFQAQLGKYPKSSILIACAKLSVGFGYGPNACTVPPENVELTYRCERCDFDTKRTIAADK